MNQYHKTVANPRKMMSVPLLTEVTQIRSIVGDTRSNNYHIDFKMVFLESEKGHPAPNWYY